MAINKHTKKLELKINVDDSQLKQLDKDLRSLSIYDVFKDNEKILGQMREAAAIKNKLKESQNAIEELEEFGLTNTLEYEELLESQHELKEALDNLTKENKKDKKKKEDFKKADGSIDEVAYKKYKKRKGREILEKGAEKLQEKKNDLKDWALDKVKESWNRFKNFIIDTMKSALEDIKKMQAADTEGLYGSKQIREENEEYGLTDSQGYALRKVLERLGQSMEDYHNGELNKKQYDRIKELTEIEEKKYDEAKESGVLDNIAEAREAFENMKEQIKMTVIRFVVDHGETIVEVLKGMFWLMTQIFKGLTEFIGFFKLDEGDSEATVAKNVNNIIYGGNTSSRTINNNVNISNTMHAQNNNITSSQQLNVQGQKNQLQIMRALEV